MRNLIATINGITNDVIGVCQNIVAGRVTRDMHLVCRVRLLFARLAGRSLASYAPAWSRAKRAAAAGKAGTVRLEYCRHCWRPLRSGSGPIASQS